MVVGLAAILGIAAGGLASWLFLRVRERRLARELADARDANLALATDAAALRERAALLGEVDRRLEDRFKALAGDVLSRSSASLLDTTKQVVEPLRQSLERVDRQAQELEQVRRQAHGALTQQLRMLTDEQERLRTATGNLATALRAPHVRGRWGEVQLRRVIEVAGMLNHCDFVEQPTTENADGRVQRPDVVVTLPGGKSVVVDSKAPLDAYLDWLEAPDDDARASRLAAHARQVRDHVTKLSQKRYWQQFDPTPDFVVMFVPDEAFLRAAQEHDASIQEHAWGAGVIPASPTNLITLLRTIATIWHQETAAENARAISALGRELYERLGTLGKHVAKLGRSLDGAVGAYNEAVGSLETRVLVTARKLDAHGVPGEVPPAAPIERQARPLQALELTVDTTDPRELTPPEPANANAA